jgi:hypothetical protein
VRHGTTLAQAGFMTNEGRTPSNEPQRLGHEPNQLMGQPEKLGAEAGEADE